MTSQEQSNDITDETPLSDELDEEALEQLDGSLPYPSHTAKDNIFKFFRRILRLKDSVKVANFNDIEIGKSKLAVRSWMQLALYAEKENYPLIEAYFRQQAEIIASSSMGRKGFFLQTSVTQIKKEQKVQVPTIEKPKMWDKKQKYQGGY